MQIKLKTAFESLKSQYFITSRTSKHTVINVCFVWNALSLHGKINCVYINHVHILWIQTKMYKHPTKDSLVTKYSQEEEYVFMWESIFKVIQNVPQHTVPKHFGCSGIPNFFKICAWEGKVSRITISSEPQVTFGWKTGCLCELFWQGKKELTISL